MNKIKDKPYTEVEEANGRPDAEVSQISWEKHLSRNQSKIVDLMHGQCKSTLVCPECGKCSITFDPFLTFTVGIPNYEVRKVEILFHSLDSTQPPMNITVSATLSTTVREVKEMVKS